MASKGKRLPQKTICELNTPFIPDDSDGEDNLFWAGVDPDDLECDQWVPKAKVVEGGVSCRVSKD